MLVFAYLVLCASLLVIVIRALKDSSPRSQPVGTLGNLIYEATLAVRTTSVYMDEMHEIFRPGAYNRVAAWPYPWPVSLRERLHDRARRGLDRVKRIESNIRIFHHLGTRALALSLGEDALAEEVTFKATACLLLVRPVKRKVRLYRFLPLLLWKAMGKNTADSCVYGGYVLIRDYEDLAETVLAFVRARGAANQYDNLLSAL